MLRVLHVLRSSVVLSEPRPLERRPDFLRGHIIDNRRRADGGRQHEVQPSGDDLLVVLHRLEDLRGREVGDRRQRTEAGDEVGQRLAVRLGQRAARAASSAATSIP